MSANWAVEENVTCVACPGCGFTFAAYHTDVVNGGVEGGHYSCPQCKSGATESTGAGSLTYDEVRACADSVQAGECITFPNGLVVDKRISWPTYYQWSPAPLGSGHTCPNCKVWVPSGQAHYCAFSGWAA